MSTEERTFTEERIRVDQRVETDEFPVPAVVLDVTSSRASAAPVRLTVDLDEEIETDAVGFHPDYGHQHWTVEGRTLVFERRFDPDETFTTVFAVRGVDAPTNLLLDEIDIDVPAAGDEEVAAGADGDAAEREAPVEKVEDIVDESGTQAIRELITGDRDDLPGLEDRARADLAQAESADPDETEPAEPTAGEAADGAKTDGVGTDETEPEGVAATDGPEDAESIELSDPGEADPAGDADAEAAPSGETVPGATPDEPAADAGAAEANGGDLEAHVTDVVEEIGTTTEAAEEPTTAGSEPVESAADGPTASEDAIADGTAAVPGSVVDALVEELGDGSLSEDDREVLREALLETERGSTTARVDHLQQRMSDIEAYTDALETFLDEHGTGTQIVEELREEIDAFEAELSELRGEVAEVDEEIDAVREELSAVGEDVTAVEDEVTAVSDDVADVSADVTDVREEVAGIDDELDEVRRELREDLREEIAADVREEVTADIEAVREDLEDDLEAAREEFEEFEEFRKRVATVFGGDGGLGDL